MLQPLRCCDLNFISFKEFKQNGAKETELFRGKIVSVLFFFKFIRVHLIILYFSILLHSFNTEYL
jgi:hypothetical protein